MYFDQFPVIFYDAVGNTDPKVVTHLLKRVAVHSKARAVTALYDTYDVRNGETPESIVSDGIYISDVNFYVTGPDRTDSVQPKVTIVIEAYNSEADAAADPLRERAYLIQTTVTQRTLDI